MKSRGGTAEEVRNVTLSLASGKRMSAIRKRAVADQLVQRDRCGAADIEGWLRGPGRQPGEEIAALTYEAAHSTALRAEHKCDTVPELQLRQW